MKKLDLTKKLFSLFFILALFMACEDGIVDALNNKAEEEEEEIELSETERLITGTWTHYRYAYDYYDCLTLNQDKTANFCRLEKNLSESSDRFHERCYIWYVQENPTSTGGTEYNIMLKVTGADDYYASYIINTQHWTMKDAGGISFTDLSNKMIFHFCD